MLYVPAVYVVALLVMSSRQEHLMNAKLMVNYNFNILAITPNKFYISSPTDVFIIPHKIYLSPWTKLMYLTTILLVLLATVLVCILFKQSSLEKLVKLRYSVGLLILMQHVQEGYAYAHPLSLLWTAIVYQVSMDTMSFFSKNRNRV